MNSVNFIGRVTRDITTSQTNNGTVAHFGIAVDGASAEKDDQGRYKAAFLDVTVFGKSADMCVQYLTKGQKCAVSGRLQYRTYQANDGTQRFKWDVIANTVDFLEKPRNEQQGGGNYQQTPAGGGWGSPPAQQQQAWGGQQQQGWGAPQQQPPAQQQVYSGGGAFDEDIPF